jgi:hypothetical protein
LVNCSICTICELLTVATVSVVALPEPEEEDDEDWLAGEQAANTASSKERAVSTPMARIVIFIGNFLTVYLAKRDETLSSKKPNMTYGRTERKRNRVRPPEQNPPFHALDIDALRAILR